MSTLMYARLTDQGTAASETAVCGEHRDLAPMGREDVPIAPVVDCTGNEALACVVCGTTTEED